MEERVSHTENCITFCDIFRKGDRIYNQVKRMGCSVDWDRAFFTMSDVSSTYYLIIVVIDIIIAIESCCKGMLCSTSRRRCYISQQ